MKIRKKIRAEYILIILYVLGIAVAALFFSSCSPYPKIAKNANPTERELSLLAIACHREFPPIDKPLTIDSVTSNNYKKQVDSLYNVVTVLDSLILSQVPIIDTAYVDSSNCLPRIRIAFSEIDRLNHQRELLQASVHQLSNQLSYIKTIKPDIVFRSSIILRCDSAEMKRLQDGFKGKSDSLLVLNTKYQISQKAGKTRLWIIIGLGIALITGIVLKIKSVLKV